jgi:hypothetical protein
MHGCMYLDVTTIYLCQRRYEAALAELEWGRAGEEMEKPKNRRPENRRVTDGEETPGQSMLGRCTSARSPRNERGSNQMRELGE